MLDSLIARVAEGAAAGPLMALLVGVLLGLSPVALPSIPAVVSVISPGQLDSTGDRRRLPFPRAAAIVVAFVAGMDGVLAGVGLAFVEFTEFLTRAGVVLHLVTAAVLALLGIRLLLRRASVCSMARSVPLEPRHAFVFGTVFAVTGCPGCGPIAMGVGAAAAAVGGPLYGLAVIGAFVAGRSAVLLASAAVGDRVLAAGDRLRWDRLDLVIGVLLLAGAAYYVYRVVAGDVSTALPGERGGILP